VGLVARVGLPSSTVSHITSSRQGSTLSTAWAAAGVVVLREAGLGGGRERTTAK
jgi:hypothetical protein